MPAPSAEAVEMIRRLVAFDTTSRDSNLALIDWVRDYLAGHGIASEIVPDETGRKANLFATIGPADRPGIVLSGHTDVVPVDGQEWSSDPFALVERDGRLHGRGTCDMKSFVAVALALVPEIKARVRATPVHFAFSYDEEVGCIGVRRLLDRLARREPKPWACIVGEPTEMKPVRAHKGKVSQRARVRGFEAHSSIAPAGVNAIEYAGELISFLLQRQRRFVAEGPLDEQFDIPYTTFSVGVIQGGIALNVVPKDCIFQFEFRHLPQVDPDVLYREIQDYAKRTLEPRMHAVKRGTGFAFEEMSSFPALDTSPDAEVTRLVKSLTRQNQHGKVAFGTEASVIAERGRIPSIVCGPGHIDQAHKPDEFTTIEQFRLCEDFMRRLADHVQG